MGTRGLMFPSIPLTMKIYSCNRIPFNQKVIQTESQQKGGPKWSPGSCVIWTCLRMFGHCVVEIETGRQKMGIASIHEILPNPCKTFTLVFPQLQRAPTATAPWGKIAPWKLCSGTMIAFPAWQRQTGRRKPRIPKLQPALRNNVGVLAWQTFPSHADINSGRCTWLDRSSDFNSKGRHWFEKCFNPWMPTFFG